MECDFNWMFHAIMMDNKYEIFAEEGAETVLKHICIDRLPENFIPTGLEIFPRETVDNEFALSVLLNNLKLERI
jgi:hypothetical protein